MQKNFYSNPTGKNINSSSDCDLEVDDLGYIRPGQPAKQMFSMGDGFEPTDEQLAAMNSGITSEKVDQISTNENNISSLQGKTTGMGTGGSNYIEVNGIKMYFDTTAPTGASVGDLWVGG